MLITRLRNLKYRAHLSFPSNRSRRICNPPPLPLDCKSSGSGRSDFSNAGSLLLIVVGMLIVTACGASASPTAAPTSAPAVFQQIELPGNTLQGVYVG